MEYKTSIRYIPSLSCEETFSLVKQAGFDAYDLAWNRPNYNPDYRGLLGAENIRKAGLKIGYAHEDYERCYSLWSGKGYPLGNTVTAIEECASVGIKNLVMHVSNKEPVDVVTLEGLYNFDSLLYVAELKNINIALENTLHESLLLDLIKKFKHRYSNLKICLDFGHANLGEYEYLFKEIKELKDIVSCVHLHDNLGKEDDHLPLYTGTVNWDRVAKLLADINYTGYLSLELKGLKTNETQTELEALILARESLDILISKINNYRKK